MDKSTGNKTIILMPDGDCRGPEDKGIHKPGTIERYEGNNGGQDKNDHRDRLGHRKFSVKVSEFMDDDTSRSAGYYMHGIAVRPISTGPADAGK